MNSIKIRIIINTYSYSFFIFYDKTKRIMKRNFRKYGFYDYDYLNQLKKVISQGTKFIIFVFRR